MSMSNNAVSGLPLADGGVSANPGKTKGPPAKRQMSALKDPPQTAELR